MHEPRADAYMVVERSERRVSLAQGRSWTIGRGEGCVVKLDSRTVSRLHALIQRMEEGDYCLIDLGSRNGSLINGRRVTIPVTLQDGDRIVVGEESLRFRRLEASTSSSMTSSLRNASTEALVTQSTATVVVADIRDYTALARSVSEEVLSQTIGTWFLRVGQAARALGSWGEKYIGDAVMAVWVHDSARVGRQDLLPALEAICQFEAATAEISSSLPLPGRLRIGAGVNTGRVILGNVENTAFGDTVNVAFRLESATKTLGLGVALGENTLRALAPDSNDSAWFQRGEVLLKGYDGASTAWAISFEDLRRFCVPRSG